MPDSEAFKKLTGDLAARFAAICTGDPRRAWIETPAEQALPALAWLRGAGYGHLSAITALDNGEEYEVLYHLWGNGGIATVKTRTARDGGELPTATGLFPGAALYEREAHDLLGVAFSGLPDSRALILPDTWPQGEHPLRKDWPGREGGGKDE